MTAHQINLDKLWKVCISSYSKLWLVICSLSPSFCVQKSDMQWQNISLWQCICTCIDKQLKTQTFPPDLRGMRMSQVRELHNSLSLYCKSGAWPQSGSVFRGIMEKCNSIKHIWLNNGKSSPTDYNLKDSGGVFYILPTVSSKSSLKPQYKLTSL